MKGTAGVESSLCQGRRNRDGVNAWLALAESGMDPGIEHVFQHPVRGFRCGVATNGGVAELRKNELTAELGVRKHDFEELVVEVVRRHNAGSGARRLGCSPSE